MKKHIFLFTLISIAIFFNLTSNAQSNQGVTFTVSDVKITDIPLSQYDYTELLEHRIQKKIYSFPSEKHNQQMVPVSYNGFLQAIQYSFNDHRPIVISPDMIWLLICQGFSIHLNKNFDSLKSSVFINEERQKIWIRNDSLVTAKPEEWDKLITGFSDSVRKYVKKDIYNSMVKNYSTTSPIEHTTYEVTMLESVQRAFELIGGSGCGIPAITLKGKLSDWQDLEKNVEFLKDYGMADWMNELKPVLHQFTEAYRGNVDIKFWKELYKQSYLIPYTSTTITGWILKFFPYIQADSSFKKGSDYYRTKVYYPNKYLKGTDYYLSDISSWEIPSGFSKVPVQWLIYELEAGNYTNTIARIRDMEVYAGFFAIKEDTNTMTIEPDISWAVCDKNADLTREDWRKVSNLNDYKDYTQHELNFSRMEQWLGGVFDTLEVPPIYAPEKNKTYEESIIYLKKYLEDSIKNIAVKKNIHIESMEVKFVLSWGATINNVKLTGNPELQSIANNILLHLPQTWSVGQIGEFDFMGHRYNKEHDDGKRFKANAGIQFKLFDK